MEGTGETTTVSQPGGQIREFGTDGIFRNFARTAPIPVWDNEIFSIPAMAGNYNNDLTIESYGASKYHDAGVRRSRIFESIVSASDREDHMVRACNTEFFIDKETHLPVDLARDLQFRAESSADTVRTFWAQLAAKITSLSEVARPTQPQRAALIHPELVRAANGIRTTVLAALLSSHGMAAEDGSANSFGVPDIWGAFS